MPNASFPPWAIALNPNLVWAWHFSGWVKLWKGESEEAIDRFKRAMRMSPKDAQLFDMHDAISAAYFVIGDYQMALTHAKAAVREKPFTLAFCIAAASSALLGNMEDARKTVEILKRYEPTLTISNLRGIYLEFRRREDYDRFANGLLKAGLPE